MAIAGLGLQRLLTAGRGQWVTLASRFQTHVPGTMLRGAADSSAGACCRRRSTLASRRSFTLRIRAIVFSQPNAGSVRGRDRHPDVRYSNSESASGLSVSSGGAPYVARGKGAPESPRLDSASPPRSPACDPFPMISRPLKFPRSR